MALFDRKDKEGDGKSGTQIVNPTKRKKKEPPKVWTKKDRYLVFYVLAFTVIMSSLLALSAREWKLPGLPRLILPKISIFKTETIVFEKENKPASREEKESADEIIKEFNEKVKNASGVYGLYIIDLETGYSYGIRQNEVFQAASLIKLPVMAAMYEKFESGEYSKDKVYSLKNEDKIAGTGSLYSKPVGTEISYQNLVKLMGKQSDNTAFHITRGLLGDEEIMNVSRKYGMTSTSLEKNETTPEDIGKFLKSLYKSRFLSKESSDEILDYLTDTDFESWIKEGVPKEIRVAHKFGRDIHVVNDAGIVFSKSPYIVVIMSKGAVEKEADKLLPELSRMIYENHRKME